MVSRQKRLERIATLTVRLAALEQDRQVAMAEAVAGGATWAEIAEALGVSAQAAHKPLPLVTSQPHHRGDLA